MIHKEHVVNFLRINGIPLSASDEEIRGALQYAKWHDKDIEYALLTLRSDVKGETTITASHGVLTGDNKLSPQTIQSLLGINVNLTRDRLIEASFEDEIEESRYGASLLVLLSITIFLAFLVLLLLMFIFKIGPYYNPLEQSLL